MLILTYDEFHRRWWVQKQKQPATELDHLATSAETLVVQLENPLAEARATEIGNVVIFEAEVFANLRKWLSVHGIACVLGGDERGSIMFLMDTEAKP